jgi:hypothetical protein
VRRRWSISGRAGQLWKTWRRRACRDTR